MKKRISQLKLNLPPKKRKNQFLKKKKNKNYIHIINTDSLLADIHKGNCWILYLMIQICCLENICLSRVFQMLTTFKLKTN